MAYTPPEFRESPPAEDQIDRRPFIVRLMAAVVGIGIMVAPVLAGAIVFLNPLRKRTEAAGRRIRVASLAAVPPDGVPHRFAVIDERVDAWNLYPPDPIGAVYLIRNNAQEKPIAFSATCPHLGCSVDFQAAAGQFKCPCHNSHWNVEGERMTPCMAPRSLDTLEVEVEGEAVFVTYQKFRGGIEKKIPE